MRELHKQVLEDAKALQEVAVENAKNVLLERLTPGIKESVIASLAEAEDEEEKEDEKEDEKEPVEEMGSMGSMSAPGAYEAKGEDADLEISLDDLKDDGEKEAPAPEAPKEEAFEITKEDFDRAWAQIRNEATVSKGFHPQADPNKEEGNAGLQKAKSGDSPWNEVEPPAAADWTVKEAKMEIGKYQHALKVATKQLAEQEKVINFLRTHLNEVNLFNHKLLYVTKLTRSPSVNAQLKEKIVEAMDSAESISEAKLVFRTFATAINNVVAKKAPVNEGKRLAKASSGSRAAGKSATLLNEGADRGKDPEYARMERLMSDVAKE